jgi:hypothetical protein
MIEVKNFFRNSIINVQFNKRLLINIIFSKINSHI